MALKITISFKPKEKKIFDHVNNQLSNSVYIKQLILRDMKNDDTPEDKIETKRDILDF